MVGVPTALTILTLNMPHSGKPPFGTQDSQNSQTVTPLSKEAQ